MGIYSWLLLIVFLVSRLGYYVILENGWWALLVALLIAFGFWVYFIPLWIARLRKHPHSTAIFFINFLLGWSILFWFVALIWAFISSEREKIKE